MFFLSGLPRSGSTLLAAILNQRTDLAVTPTSGLIDIMGAVCQSWENNPSTLAQKQTVDSLHKTLRKLLPDESNKMVMDKSRGWVSPEIQTTMSSVLGTPPKIIATVRNIDACVASFARLVKPEDMQAFLKGHLVEHLKSSYITLKRGYDAYPQNIFFVEYEDLVNNPEETLSNIENFLGIPSHTYNLSKIDGSSVAEDDENAWGVPGLHTVAPELKKTALEPSEILGEFTYRFQVDPFWRTPQERPKDLMDVQLEMSLSGNLKGAEDLCETIFKLRPNDDRVAFNKGWFELAKGNLKEGFKLLDRGRNENIFGNTCPVRSPKYDGRLLNGETVLLVLEGGLGDQIHSVRWAREIKANGGRCVVSCSPELAELFVDVDGVEAVVESRAAGGVFHQYHLMGMSGYLAFNRIDATPYIKQTVPVSGGVGLRWAGNPQFEHQQHRTFDPTPLFSINRNLVSLQRDVATDAIQPHLHTPDISTWSKTRDVISSLDEVITSCTSVAHLAAAMGKKTTIIVPILPYYLWADGQSSSIWYDTVTLVRQTDASDWSEPLNSIVRSYNDCIDNGVTG